jgi:cation diffusion facilitator CzcD-associated flavoprotein CzcO
MPHIRFGVEGLGAQWDDDARVWRLQTSEGEHTAKVLIGGMGGLTEPQLPDIEGLDSFEGTLFHSSRWDHDHDLEGERVAVIGTGASAIQFVPKIQPKVGQLKLFQRTPAWVLPDPDRKLGERERELYRSFPLAQRTMRALTYLSLEATVVGTIVDRRLIRLGEKIGRRHIASQVSDPELRAKLTPSYTLGCKRITLSNSYYRALTQPNAEVITEAITEIRANSLITADGEEHEVDTIILGTGFKVFDNPGMAMIHGRDGRSLLDHWQGSPRAYLGTAVPAFPNLFFIVGPNSAGGFNSIIFTSEAHINYVARCLKEMDRQGVDTVEVKPEVYDAFNRDTERRLATSVWNEGGCASWYLDENGRNGVWWPTFMARLWQRTRRFDAGNYRATPA